MNYNAQRQGQQDEFRPPAISLAVAIGAFLLTYWLYRLGVRGVEWGPFLSLFTGGYGAYQIIKALNDWDKLRDFRRRYGRFEQAAKEHRPSRFGDANDLQQSEEFL